MALSAELIHGFTKSLLAHKFDSPKPTPEFHIEMWDYCCSEERYVAIAAPRGHAKSTAISLCYVLAALMFREVDYVWIISDTETQSIQFLADIKAELLENEEMRALFQIKKSLKDNEKDIIWSMGPDNHKFRITAKSTGGSVRGGKWNNKRPNLIVGDDLENDEIVLNLDRREKFRQWFFGAVLPALSDHGKIRIVGTILHFDSFLNRLMPPMKGEGSEFTVREDLKVYSTDPNRPWKTILYRSHPSIDDFSKILWPDKFSEKRLRQIRATYIAQGFPEGYSQEYLNNPIDDSNAFFKRDDFLEMNDDDHEKVKEFYIAGDFAVSVKDRADYSVLIAGGIDDEGMLHIPEVRRGRWDSKEIIDQLFSMYMKYKANAFITEKGVIDSALGPYIEDEMFRKNRPFLSIERMTASTDKRTRARAIQGRMRAGGVKFNKDGDWYIEFEDELLKFDRGVHDDQVDAFAWLGLFINNMHDAPTKQEIEDMEYEDELNRDQSLRFQGRNSTTGY